MGRKKGERETTLIRVYRDFAEPIKQASAERGLTVAEFSDTFLRKVVDKSHRDYIRSESQKMDEGSK